METLTPLTMEKTRERWERTIPSGFLYTINVVPSTFGRNFSIQSIAEKEVSLEFRKNRCFRQLSGCVKTC